MNRRIDISHKTVIFITIFLLGLWLLFQIKEVIILFFVAIIFMSALAPLVERLVKWRIPKALAIALSYILTLAILGLLVTSVFKPLVEQVPMMIATAPHLLEESLPKGTVDRSFLQDQLSGITGNAVSVTFTVFSNIVTFISVAVLTFYLLLERDRAERLLAHLFVGNEGRARKLIERIEFKLGAWMRGQLILTIVIGVMVYIVLFLMGIPYALPLAILAGFMEVVPVIGPIISAIPAVAMAFVVSPVSALTVAGAFFVIQQLENNLIVPQVMKRAVGINPLVVILAIAIGGKLLGIPGALLAVPITVVIQLIIEEVLGKDISA